MNVTVRKCKLFLNSREPYGDELSTTSDESVSHRKFLFPKIGHNEGHNDSISILIGEKNFSVSLVVNSIFYSLFPPIKDIEGKAGYRDGKIEGRNQISSLSLEMK